MNTDIETLREERSRDRWLAVSAAKRLAAREPISTIESEPLENLSEWIRAELQDRDLRENTTMNTMNLF